MNYDQKQFIGALIGLAKATDGNEHLITDDITDVIIKSLRAIASNVTDLSGFFDMVDVAKRKLAPDCYRCANPCGRTAPYDLALLDEASADIRAVKYRILHDLLRLSEKSPNPEDASSFYCGLLLIAMDGYTAEELEALFLRK